MSAIKKPPHLEVIDRREDQPDIHVLFVGTALFGTKKVFKRDNDPVKCQHENYIGDAVDRVLEQSKSLPFDCVMIDMRHKDDGSPLHVVSIAALNACRHIAVLAKPEDVETFEQIEGVDFVLPAPIEPMAIIRTIVSCSPAEEEEEVDELQEPTETANSNHPADEPAASEEEESEDNNEANVTKGFETTISKAAELDQQVWQRFVPLANFVYKKLAITVLTALFLTFLTYGAMIVFFMASSSWSLPFELSRGHVLVEKAARDLASMRLRRNQIKQDFALASRELEDATRNRRDAKLNLVLVERTIQEEINIQTAQGNEIKSTIARLRQVIGDFNDLNGKGGYARTLESAFARRLITRKAMNSGTLAVLETMHRLATVENEISEKLLEADKIERRLEFLKTLLSEVNQPEVRVITSAGSDLSHLAKDVIAVKNEIANADRLIASTKQAIARQQNSLDVAEANIAELEQTPIGRAIEAPVTVLFVPYDNAPGMKPGSSLYSCTFSIVVCREVATVGETVKGETNAVHPLFGKPMRGVFVEADFKLPSYATEELVHVGRPPLFF